MIEITDTNVFGWEAAVRGMRNPMNSWDKSDSEIYIVGGTPCFAVGVNDLKLMQSLAKAGDDHGKFLRMIHVQADITAPLYWWKEYDTYKVGTVANSCSTMHKLHDRKITLADFSCEYLVPANVKLLEEIIENLNSARNEYVDYDGSQFRIENDSQVVDKSVIWYQMIQLLPQSYNQKRTVDLNYQVLAHMYFARRNHKLNEWHEFCAWVEGLPYFREIVIQEGEDGEQKRLS